MAFKGGSGALNHWITFQRLPDPTGARNSFGELTAEPVEDIAGVPAAYEPVGGREFPEAQKRHSETTGRFRVRYRRDLNAQRLPATHRITEVIDEESSPLLQRIYDITWADVVGRLEEIHIEVSEIR